jgi:hypothetical protein
MCFSANASLGAGLALSVIGVLSIKKVQRPSLLLFASIPFIFGVQQIAEGVLWLTLPHPEYINTQRVATFVFLFFAQLLWPLWVPIAILMAEKKETRKNIQKVLVGLGLLMSFYLAYCLLTFNVEAKIIGKHITYFQNYPVSLQPYSMVLYLIVTITPTFFSHVKHMWLLGICILISYIITMIFYQHYVVSVWCFFSSIISLSIYAIIRGIVKTEQKENQTVL